jgi:shikimate kinase
MHKIIYLTGFMGAGKSTIGPILANTIGWESCDLDVVIEKKTDKKVRQIFVEEGEKYFREIETEMLKELSTQLNLVVSLGGGTMASEKNLSILKSTGLTIYLKASPESFYKRLKHKRNRPSLGDPEAEDYNEYNLLNRINDLMGNRSEYYEQADIIVDTDNSTVGKTVDRIVKMLKKFEEKSI